MPLSRRFTDMAKSPKLAALTPVAYVLGFADPETASVDQDGRGYVQIKCITNATQYGGSIFGFDINDAPSVIRNQAKAHVAAYILGEEGTVVATGNIKISAMFE